LHAERLQQRSDGGARGQLPRLSVDPDVHGGSIPTTIPARTPARRRSGQWLGRPAGTAQLALA
jgi:hypothetical protein